MGNLIIIFILAIQVEAIWETLKMVWQDGKVNIDRIGALTVGIIIALAANLRLNELLGNPLIFPTIDIILTGILISRGSNFIHDLLSKLTQ